MDDILASIRKILDEEGTRPEPEPVHAPAAVHAPEPEVLELEPSMILPEPAITTPGPVPPPPPVLVEPLPPPPIATPPALVAPAAAAAASASVGALMRTLAQERTTATHRGGPTIEDLVRDELRPLLKSWLDQHLAEMVERLVRAEIERVVSRLG